MNPLLAALIACTVVYFVALAVLAMYWAMNRVEEE